MKKETILGVGALLIILAIVIFYAATKPLPARAPSAATTLPADKYVEQADYYEISADYPSRFGISDGASTSSTPPMSEKDAAAVALMKKFVSDTIAQFKIDGNFANLTAEDVRIMGLGTDRKEKLQIVYLISSSPRTISYIFTVYEDTLGAHGNTFFHTFTFDTSSGTALSLSDVFVPSTDYLAKLSELSRAKLPSTIGGDADVKFIQDGTTPEMKNFQNFFFDNKDFVILFDPYAVAPYSSGPQTLRISLSELANILKPEYR